MAIIELFSNLIQFCSKSVKLYYYPIIKIDENFDQNTENILLEMRDNPKYQDVLRIYFLSDIFLNFSIFNTSDIFITCLTVFLNISTLAKCRGKKPWKYPMQKIFLTLTDTSFIIDNFYYDNINMKLLFYTLSK